MAKRATVSGTTLRARPLEEKAAIVQGVRDQVWPLIEQGRIRPVIHGSVPLRDAAQAHRIVESSEHIGKVLLIG
jgi:NADPH:quinone reductase-like Zn-dependent oxidoreductase